MTGLEKDFLNQLTRIADALEKQNKLQEEAMASMNSSPSDDIGIEENQIDAEDLSNLLKKLTKFK